MSKEATSAINSVSFEPFIKASRNARTVIHWNMGLRKEAHLPFPSLPTQRLIEIGQVVTALDHFQHPQDTKTAHDGLMDEVTRLCLRVVLSETTPGTQPRLTPEERGRQISYNLIHLVHSFHYSDQKAKSQFPLLSELFKTFLKPEYLDLPWHQAHLVAPEVVNLSLQTLISLEKYSWASNDMLEHLRHGGADDTKALADFVGYQINQQDVRRIGTYLPGALAPLALVCKPKIDAEYANGDLFSKRTGAVIFTGRKFNEITDTVPEILADVLEKVPYETDGLINTLNRAYELLGINPSAKALDQDPTTDYYQVPLREIEEIVQKIEANKESIVATNGESRDNRYYDYRRLHVSRRFDLLRKRLDDARRLGWEIAEAAEITKTNNLPQLVGQELSSVVFHIAKDAVKAAKSGRVDDFTGQLSQHYRDVLVSSEYKYDYPLISRTRFFLLRLARGVYYEDWKDQEKSHDRFHGRVAKFLDQKNLQVVAPELAYTLVQTFNALKTRGLADQRVVEGLQYPDMFHGLGVTEKELTEMGPYFDNPDQLYQDLLKHSRGWKRFAFDTWKFFKRKKITPENLTNLSSWMAEMVNTLPQDIKTTTQILKDISSMVDID